MPDPTDPSAPRPETAPAARVEHAEIECVRCGYGLFGLDAAGQCPECGALVSDSLKGRLLIESDPAYVRAIDRGVKLILIGMIASVVIGLGAGVFGAAAGFATAFTASRTTAPAPVVTTTPAPGGGAPLAEVTPSPDGETPDASVDGRGAGAPGPEADAPPIPDAGPAVDDGTDAGPIGEDAADTAGSVSVTATPAPPNTPIRVTGFGGGPGIGSPRGSLLWWASVGAVWSGVLVEFLLLWGWWLFSTPDPTARVEDIGEGPRRIIRASVIAVAITSLVATLSVGGYAANPFGTAGLTALGMWALATLAKVARFFAAMLYVRWLADRLPDEFVARRSRMYLWLLPLLYTVGNCIIIGPIIAAVLMWMLLFRVHKTLRAIMDRHEAGEGGGAVRPVTPAGLA